ncbi:MAG: YlcI/YnfO family protein [Actinomycetota bacterium]
MTKQTTVRLPVALAEEAEAAARVQNKSVNEFIVDALTIEIDRVRKDPDFVARVKRLVERDREILDRLAE